MAFTSDRNLKSDPTINLRDQEHAARVFADNQFRLAPKFKFLFHVSFGINAGALQNANIVQRYGNEINLMVKSVDLPQYKVETELLNQYNRKKVVQYTHKPQEISITFHDDNMGLINQLWQSYYSYYYADPTSASQPGAYNRTAMRSFDYINNSYGLDNSSTSPFFNYIKIYQMARHEYVQYTLTNPIISNWNHNKLDYAQNALHDFTMKIQYEAVSYSAGAVAEGDPEGFAMEHYDQTPSPLSGQNPDPTVNNPSFVESLDIQAAAPSILNQVIQQVNTAQNTQQPTTVNGTPDLITPNTVVNTGGVPGISFPQAAASSNNTTTALPTSITGR
jgi:hypothetical protein